MGKISGIVHTKNSAATLAKALKSLSFVDEVLVIDMQSQDETLKIAQQHEAKIIAVKDVGFVEPARNDALALASHEWILILDADEEVSPKLRIRLQQIASTGSEVVAFYLPRKNIIFGEWIAHTGWWPDYQLRFFKKGCVTWPKTIHAQPSIVGSSKQLEADDDQALIHHNYQNLEQFIDRLNRYTSITAESTTSNTQATLSASEVFETFTQQFLARYFAQAGWRDGTHGMSLSLLQGIYEVVIKLKSWQKQGFAPRKASPETQLEVFRSLQRELNYWLADWQVQRSSGLPRILWQVRRKWKL